MSQIGINCFFLICYCIHNPTIVLIVVVKCGNSEDLRGFPMMKLLPRRRSLRRRQCAALCAKIRLHVTRLMESARFYCNRKLFCVRRLRPSYRTSHMLTRPVREKERKREKMKDRRSFPCLAKFSMILYCILLVELHSTCSFKFN